MDVQRDVIAFRESDQERTGTLLEYLQMPQVILSQ